MTQDTLRHKVDGIASQSLRMRLGRVDRVWFITSVRGQKILEKLLLSNASSLPTMDG